MRSPSSPYGQVRRGRLTVALLVAALIFAACGGGDDDDPGTGAGGDDPAGEVSEGATLRVAHPVAPSTLDPQTGNSGYDHIVLYTMFDTLVNFTPDTMEPIPGLASSWEFTDETTLVMQLQEGVTFHDGTPFDAEAVKYNIERAKTYENSNIAGDLTSVESVEVLGELEVQLNLVNPDTALPLILSDRAGMMVSPTAAEEQGDAFDRNPVGAGPFRFVEWRTGDSVQVERYEDYWGEAPTLGAIEFSIIIERDTALNSVLAGEQDFTFLVEPKDAERVETADGIESSISSNLFHYEFYTNNGRPPFDDKRVRQAFNYAIDREAFLEASQFGLGEISWMPLPSDHWAFAGDLVPTYPYDPERARELLAEAGYPDGLEITTVGWTASADIRRAEILKAQLAEVGIDLTINTAEVPQATAQFFDEKRFDSYLAAWTGRPDPSLTYKLLFSEAGYFNTAGLATPGLEELLLEAQAVQDQEERAATFEELTALVVEEALYVPLAFAPDFAAHTDRLSNYEPNLLGKPRLAHVALSE